MSDDDGNMQDLLHLAQKSRDRVNRIFKRAREMDARGDEVENKSTSIMSQHEQFLASVEKQLSDIEAFNREMQKQFGNEPPGGGEPSKS